MPRPGGPGHAPSNLPASRRGRSTASRSISFFPDSSTTSARSSRRSSSRKAGQSRAAAPKTRPRAGQGPNRLTALVLVVDDHTDLREFAARVLASSGYDVIEAFDGRDAISSLCRHAPDLVVLDLNMPGMDGWQFRAEQEALPDGHLAAIPVLLVTGRGRRARSCRQAEGGRTRDEALLSRTAPRGRPAGIAPLSPRS